MSGCESGTLSRTGPEQTKGSRPRQHQRQRSFESIIEAMINGRWPQ